MKTCEIEGCDKPNRAKGLCSTHYNQQHQPDRHRKVEVPCDWCGRSCPKDPTRHRRYGALFCGSLCRDAWRAYQARGVLTCAVPSRALVLYVPPEDVEDVTNWRRWVSGHCARCGDWFVAEDYTNTARYCSLRCSRRVNKHRYRARRTQGYRQDVSPAAIYVRDGWRCQICKRKVRRGALPPHPLAPVLDHIVPLVLGGTHEPTNVQLAHFRCNSLKGHREVGDQLLLFG